MGAIRKFFKYLILALFALSIFPSVAFAYLDPGTGSYLFQVLVGAFLGGLFAIKMFWRNIRTFISKLLSRGASEDRLTEDSSKRRDLSE